ncbi:MAG: SxtJ family membrane protein [Thermoanaerobaculales bacterium]|nr:SxtJ family membrane protein [Thermoanaerobaculales bacterium]
MSVVQINRHPTLRQLRQFGWIWMAFVTFFGAVAWFKFDSPVLARGLWVAAIAVPVLGWAVPKFMRFVFLGMSYLAWPIGFVVSHLVLAGVYYLVLTPIGLLMRLFGYDSMKRTFDREAASYWVPRSPGEVDPKRHFRQF